MRLPVTFVEPSSVRQLLPAVPVRMPATDPFSMTRLASVLSTQPYSVPFTLIDGLPPPPAFVSGGMNVAEARTKLLHVTVWFVASTLTHEAPARDAAVDKPRHSASVTTVLVRIEYPPAPRTSSHS